MAIEPAVEDAATCSSLMCRHRNGEIHDDLLTLDLNAFREVCI
jgi:hypothetical protein